MDNSNRIKRKAHPFDRANPVSLVTYGYTFGMFRKGFKKEFEEDDIYDVVRSCKSKTLGDLAEHKWKKTHSLLKLMLYRFGVPYFLISLGYIAWTETSSILTPFGLSKLIAYFTPDQTKITKNQAYQYAGIVVFLKLGAFLVMSNLRLCETMMGMKIHASLKSLLYRKALKLSSSASSETNLGNLITLITKDVNTIEMNLWLFKDVTTFFIQFFTLAYLLYDKMGTPAFIGLTMIFIPVPIQVFLSSKLKELRMKVQSNSDIRLQRTQETLSAIKIIKMYTWEQFFYDRISESRKVEIRALLKVFLVQSVNTILGMMTSKITFMVLILCYIWMGYETNTELIYYVSSLFSQLNMQFGVAVPNAFVRIAQIIVSIQRLNKVLQADELERPEDESTEKPIVLMKDVGFKLGNKDILSGITMNIFNPGLTVVTGPVGAGKSSLLRVILKDYYPVSEGVLEIHGNVSFASQDPWLFPGTIRQNILFGAHFDKKRYDDIVRVCALEYDFSLLEHGDLTVVSDRGMNLSKGQQARINLARAVYRQANIYLLDDSLTALDNHVKEHIFNECLLKYLSDRICILVSQNARHIDHAESVIVLREGKMVFSGNAKDIDKKYVDKITAIMNEKNRPSTMEEVIESKEKQKILESEQEESRTNVYKEIKKTGRVTMNVYEKYFHFGGGLIVFSVIIVIYIAAQFCDSMADKKLSKWVDYQQNVIDLENNHTTNGTEYDLAVSDKNNAFNLYITLIVTGIVIGFVKYYALLKFCQNASVNLHKAMTKGLIGGTMAFFDNHFIGNIINRFSYDLFNIDETIPFLFPGLGGTLFSAGGSIILITSVNWFFLFPALVFLMMLILIRWLVMPTARSLKRLEAATRSPLVGHINSSLEGLTTIRAFRAEDILKKEFDKHQDLYTSAFMSLRIGMMALGYFMDFFAATFCIVIISRFLFFETSTTAGNVGLAISQVFSLTSYVQFCVILWSDLENCMTSVERAVEYTSLKQETKDGLVGQNWPVKGGIIFEKVDLCYEGCKTSVLKAIDLEIKPQEKIGIVGRTGAGKSSIITVLYRMYDFDGKVEIDGVDTKTLSLEYLRQNISIIPQDPILFTGTFRENIDPKNIYTDEHIWEVIDRCRIKEFVPTLETFIENSGAKYSSGQKQLVCLARAAIAKCKILVLDEATANMDHETDKLLISVVDDIFADCTVITIAHRLHSILKCDRVIVLDQGNIIEFENPKVLMERKGTLFRKMCKESSKMD